MSQQSTGPLRMQPNLSLQAAREVRLDTPLRRARTCYGHLAGVGGVDLMDHMLFLGWLEETRPRPVGRHVGYAFTASGIQALESRKVDTAVAARTAQQVAYGCFGWTERRQHLGGVLGRAIADALDTGGYISRTSGSRAVEILRDLEHWLDEGEIRC